MAPYPNPNPEWARPIIALLAKAFTPELLKKQFQGGRTASAGHCYAASEALYHALGGKEAGWKPLSLKVEQTPHWLLEGPQGVRLDPTWDQFQAAPDYSQAKGCGFLTKEPSARALRMMEIAGLAPNALRGFPAAPERAKSASSEKPWIWLDVDDVLVDTSATIEASLRRITGIELPTHTWASHQFLEMYKLGTERAQEMREAWRDDRVLEAARIFPGAAEGTRIIEAKGYNLGLITARGWHEQGREITQAMADEHQMPVSRIILATFADSKAELLLGSGTVVAGLADDTARHVEACRGQGWNARLIHQPWNAARQDLPRSQNLLSFARDLAPAHLMAEPENAPARKISPG